MYKFILFIILSFSLSLFGASRLPHGEKLLSEINEIFMENGEFSDEKIDAYRAYIKIRRFEILNALVDYGVKFKQKSNKKVIDKAEREKEIKLFDFLLNELDELGRLEREDALESALRILEIDYALKVRGSEIPIVKGYQMISNLLKSHRVHKNNLLEGEATNLVTLKGEQFYTQEELYKLKMDGFDLSKLNPPKTSTFWKQHDISKVDVKKRYRGENDLYADAFTSLPKKKGKFKKIRKTQTKPKIDFTSKVKGKKRKYKLKLGAEMHSEITAAALASTLGFHVDISRFVKDFKIELPKDMTLVKLKREWNSYFDEYDFDKYVKSVGKDNNGDSFVIFKEALIETKPKELTRIGPWAWGEHGHKSLRETRGLFLFNVWISNNDLKESGNNKLVMKERENGEKEFFHYQHDLGFSFGRFFREKPNDFQWNIVKKNNKEAVDLYYYSFQTNSGFEHVGYSDAKWMVRLIAQLSREQITEAVELGGWPKEVGMLLVEKLIARRNSLVTNFDLFNEYGHIPYNRFISTPNGVLMNGELTKNKFDDSTQDYKSEVQEILSPVYEGLESIAVKAALKATTHFDTIVIDGDTLGYDGSLIGELEISADREIVNNPDQKGMDDNFLVQDTVKVRIGLGAGIVVRGKVNYIKEYKLIYPVKTAKEGRYKNGFIFNALLPKDVRQVQLPDQYVLILEDSLEGEGELMLGMENFPFSLSMAKSYGKLTRTVVSKKVDSFEVYRDISPYKAFHKKLFAELLFFRIPIWHSPGYEGVLNRAIYKLNINNEEDKSLLALDELLSSGNMKSIVELGEKRELISNYVSKRSDSSLFGFFKSKEKRRTDDVSEVVYEKNGEINEKTFFQIDIDRSDEWKIFGDGELKRNKLRLLGRIKNKTKLIDPYLDIGFTINDKTTRTTELKDIYFKMIDELALKKRFINFSPKLHTVNNMWGNTFVQVRLGFDRKALDKIINTSSEEYFELMAMNSRYSYQTKNWWKRRTNKNLSVSMKAYKRKLRNFLSLIKKAKNAKTEKIRYMLVVDAIDQMLWRGDGAFNVSFLKRINFLVGNDNYFMDALITMPENKEMIYPAGTPLYNVINSELRRDINIYEFDFETPEEIWSVFY